MQVAVPAKREEVHLIELQHHKGMLLTRRTDRCSHRVETRSDPIRHLALGALRLPGLHLEGWDERHVREPPLVCGIMCVSDPLQFLVPPRRRRTVRPQEDHYQCCIRAHHQR